MAPKLNLFYTLKLGPPSKKSDNFSQHWLGIDGTMIVALYLKSVDWRNDRAAVLSHRAVLARGAQAIWAGAEPGWQPGGQAGRQASSPHPLGTVHHAFPKTYFP